MMTADQPTPVEATFFDLSTVYEELMQEFSSQKTVRSLFAQLLQEAYWLTERAASSMGTEGKSIRKELGTRNPAVAALFELRNALHESDLRLGFDIAVTTYLGQTGNIELLGRTSHTQEESAPAAGSTLPVGLVILPCDPNTGEADYSALANASRRIRFHVVPKRDHSQICLAEAGTSDVHVLAERSFRVLKRFFQNVMGIADAR